MRHQKYREWLLLSLYGELKPAQRERLHRHLDTCQACRGELAELREFHNLADSARIEPEASLLSQARAQFRGALSAERRHAESKPRGWLDNVSWFPQPALLAAFCLLAGLGIGFLLFRTSTGTDADFRVAGDQELRIANVQWIDPVNGEIEIQFDAVRPVRLRGNVNQPRIRAALSETLLNSGNPGLRMRAVGALEEGRSKTLDQDVKRALIHSMKFDENAGVRKRALNALTEAAVDNDIKDAFVQVLLRDENPGMRVAAIGALESAGSSAQGVDPELLKMLQDRLESEQNDYIRLRSKAFLQEARFQ